MEEELRMKGFYNSVNELFNTAACSTEYKALLAEMLARKWRAISDNLINKKLAEISQETGKEQQKDVQQDSHKA